MNNEPGQTNCDDTGCWINLSNPTTYELDELARDYNILPESLTDLLDIDEPSRVEKEEDYLMVILRVPLNRPDQEIPYITVPLGVIFAKGGTIITVCQAETGVIKDLKENKVRKFSSTREATFLLHLFMRSATYYLKFLKEINRRTSLIERDLRESIENKELVQLLALQKSLVYFNTSIRGNELLLEKVKRQGGLRFEEDDQDLFEDCLTESKQANEMARIYSSILTGTMDAFASVISNNLNTVMQRLTLISLVLMAPTLIASLYGMNVHLPFQESPWAFVGIMGGSFLFSLLVALLLKGKRVF